MCYVQGLAPILSDVHHKLVIPFVMNPKEEHCLLLGFRDMGKTSIIRARITQRMLQDPNRRILLISEKKGFSKLQVRTIKTFFQNNKYIKWCFPDIVWQDPDRKNMYKNGKSEVPNTWSLEELTLKRTINVPEATLTAGTLNPMPTGGHFTEVWFDDLVVPENSDSIDLMKKVKRQFNYFYSIITNKESDRCVEGPMFVSGTVYDEKDLNNQLKSDDDYKKLIIPCYLTPELAQQLGREYTGHNKDLTVPERFSHELLKKKKSRGAYVFSCQYLLEPHDEKSTLYKASWLRQRYKQLPENVVFAIIIDPAGEEKTDTGKSTVLVIAIDEKLKVYCITASRANYSPQELGRVIILHRNLCKAKYGQVPEVGMEKAAVQTAFKSVIEMEADEPFVIKDLRHFNTHWFTRAYPMAARAQNGGLLFPDAGTYPQEQWWVNEIIYQLVKTTKKKNKGQKDWWDCIAYADQLITFHHVRPPMSGDNAYRGDDGMEVEDDIIGY